MSTDPEPSDAPASSDAEDQTAPAETPDGPSATDDTAELNEGGKKALASERKARRDAERRMKQLETELDEFRTSQLTDQEKAVATARTEGKAEADEAWQQRWLSAEVRAEAARQGAIDPDDIVRLIDLEGVSVTDGQADGVTEAVTDLLGTKPHLVRSEPRFTVPGDGGEGTSSALPTFTRTQLADNSFYRANETAIRAAMRDGRIIDDRVGQ